MAEEKQGLSKIEVLKSATRPVIICMLILGAFYLITEGIKGEYVDWWMRITWAATAEWILERPVLKVVNGLKK